MGVARLFRYTAFSAAIGAAASYFTDMSVGEGARQALVAGLPMALALSTLSVEKNNGICQLAKDDPYLFPVLSTAVSASAFLLGALGIEGLTGRTFNYQLVASVGALEGALVGVTHSLIMSLGPKQDN